MHSFLIIGVGKAKKEVEKELSRLDAKPIYFNLAKIADTKELLRMTRIKIFQKTAIVIENFDKATEEAQNSFLKELEEPQENLYYILTANSETGILATILSRCKVIRLSDKDFSSHSLQKTKEFIAADKGEKLKIISKISDREKAIEFLDELIKGGHRLFLDNHKLAGFLKEANQTLQNLEANGNVQLQLTNFIITLD